MRARGKRSSREICNIIGKLKIMLGRSSCVGGPGIMNNDFYGNGKTTCRLRWKKATQYAFAMKVCVCVRRT